LSIHRIVTESHYNNCYTTALEGTEDVDRSCRDSEEELTSAEFEAKMKRSEQMLSCTE